ncbi:RimK family alpha-L-glutamate ligase [Aquabacter sp. L1I39]|uniref:RimK family alpha-L-glutamate ligase n=1 Tax=Aquabacter sp. L1I39 TaxID=2820278 RepID=UPI001ADCD8E5|nr:RimK family alpha-L-glutamate ligase [Aquabacter sp. L1I39]QTL03697.1 RimK family alpha-L-glutamate ligase [Aquabacter sp. L1I39]
MTGPAPVALFAEKPDWHTSRLLAALEEVGREGRILPLSRCGFAIGESTHGLILPGFEDRLPAAAFVRTVPDGSTEEITLRLGVLHALGALGVKVVNSARAIERCVDKAMTSFLIARAGLPTPRTFALQDRAPAQALIDAAPGDTVLKPLFGSQGRGLQRLSPHAAVPEADTVEGVFYLQDFVTRTTGPHADYRVFVVGGRAQAAMRRVNDDWITNIHQGAEGEPVPATGALAELAEAAAGAVGAEVAGVDLIEDGNGRLLVLEVNSMPAWNGLCGATGRDMAEPIAALLCGAPAPA